MLFWVKICFIQILETHSYWWVFKYNIAQSLSLSLLHELVNLLIIACLCSSEVVSVLPVSIWNKIQLLTYDTFEPTQISSHIKWMYIRIILYLKSVKCNTNQSYIKCIYN